MYWALSQSDNPVYLDFATLWVNVHDLDTLPDTFDLCSHGLTNGEEGEVTVVVVTVSVEVPETIHCYLLTTTNG